ncbi:MAG: hypothetical protein AAGH15_18995 [Myxococcota bacterium]
MGLPLGAIVAGRWAQSPDAEERSLGRSLGWVLLYVAFNVSCLAIWGALLRPRGDDGLCLLVAFLLMQPVAAVATSAAARAAPVAEARDEPPEGF